MHDLGRQAQWQANFSRHQLADRLLDSLLMDASSPSLPPPPQTRLALTSTIARVSFKMIISILDPTTSQTSSRQLEFGAGESKCLNVTCRALTSQIPLLCGVVMRHSLGSDLDSIWSIRALSLPLSYLLSLPPSLIYTYINTHNGPLPLVWPSFGALDGLAIKNMRPSCH